MASDPKQRYDVFLSHNSGDKPAVEELARKLRGQGLAPFLDKWHLVPGEPWQEALEAALAESSTCAVFLGPGGISAWENEEMRAALEEQAQNPGFRVIPVLLPGTTMPETEGLPRFLRRRTWVDFRSGLEDREALKRLVAGIGEDVLPCVWHVPFHRNPYFTGREEDLERLHQALRQEPRQPQVLSGLGGIGKTQTAVEYAYRYRDEYQAVLWTQAGSTSDLVSGFAEIARLLDLPEKAQEQEQIGEAVRRWLRANRSWLLVFDNADDPESLRSFVPTDLQGHVLVTSRSQDWSALAVGQAIPLETFPREESVAFLQRRTQQQTMSPAERAAAEELAGELGDLALALEQAGAYVFESRGRIEDYLKSYRVRHLDLLRRARPKTGDYPESVATTWEMNFRAVAKSSAAAAELLRLSAFLAPDAIPRELLSLGAPALGRVLAQALSGADEDPLRLDDVLKPLLDYSLIERDPAECTYSVHRMVQEVVRDAMAKSDRRVWVERVVEALVRAQPGSELDHWPRCDRLVPHWRSAAGWIEKRGLESETAGALLDHAGVYARTRGRYGEAQPLLEASVSIRERLLGSDHPDLAASLNDLGELYRLLGRYGPAVPLLQRALRIREQKLGPKHPDVASSLNNLAVVYYDQGKNARAAPLFERALSIREREPGLEDPDVAMTLANLASLHRAQGEYGIAQRLAERSLSIRERTLGTEHPDFAKSLNNLASLYWAQGEYGEAEPLLKRSLQIKESVLGPDHPSVATSLKNLGGLYRDQGEYAQAEPLLLRSLSIREQALGAEHPDFAGSLYDLALLYRKQARYATARSLYERSLRILETALGPDHPSVASTLNSLGVLDQAQGEYAQAQPLLERALSIWEKALGEHHPKIATGLGNLSRLYREQGEHPEARRLLKRSLAIREQALGEDHPGVAWSLNDLARSYQAQGEYAQAQPLYERSLSIREQALGVDHPDVGTSLNDLAFLAQARGEYRQAVPFYQRSISVLKQALGADHPHLAIVFANYSRVLQKLDRREEAAEAKARAEAIRAQPAERRA